MAENNTYLESLLDDPNVDVLNGFGRGEFLKFGTGAEEDREFITLDSPDHVREFITLRDAQRGKIASTLALS